MAAQYDSPVFRAPFCHAVNDDVKLFAVLGHAVFDAGRVAVAFELFEQLPQRIAVRISTVHLLRRTSMVSPMDITSRQSVLESLTVISLMIFSMLSEFSGISVEI